MRGEAIDGRRIRVRWTAREAVVDGRTEYTVALIPDSRTSGIRHGFTLVDLSRDVAAGQTAQLTLSRGSYPPGRFTIRVRYRTDLGDPSIGNPLEKPGSLVGTTRARVGLTPRS